jgi:PAS domain S-box-containing protein
MPVKRYVVRSKPRRENRKRRPRRDHKVAASAGGVARELTRADMKKIKATSRALPKFSANGAVRKNGTRKLPASAPVFKHPRTELEAAIQRYVDLFEFAPIGYVSFNRVGRIQEINLAAAQILGGSRSRLVGQPFALRVTKKDGALFLNHLLRCRSSQSRVETELHLKKRNGEIILAHLASSPMTSSMKDGALLYQTAIVDLTEQKRADEAIRHSEERYRTLFNLGPMAVYTIDSSGVIRDFNRQAAELWGREPALGDTDQRFCGSFKMFRPDGSFMPHDQCPMADVVSGKTSAVHNGEVLIERPDGSHVTVLVNIRPLKNDRGEVTGAINCFYDITERKQTEALIAFQKEALERAASGASLMEILKFLARAVEGQSHQRAKIAMHLLDEAGKHFEQTAAPSLPASYAKAIKGMEVSSAAGPCCAAISRRQRVEVGDVATSKQFAPFAAFALPLDIRAGWSIPIFSSTGKVLGTFATYYREPRKPAPQDNLLGEIVTRMASVIIERKQAEAALERSKNLLEQRVRERTRELLVANEELSAEIGRRKGLEGEILEISDREQQRLGQELHDGLCQHLTAVAFMARSMASRLKNHRVIEVDDIEKIAQLVNDAAANTRDLSRGLHRIDVDAVGLIGALRDLVDREFWKTPCRLEVKPSFCIENDAAAAQLYLLAREAVINANKHAQAREIVIALGSWQKEIVLSVTDDGVGFQCEGKSTSGLGLPIMKYRARSIGGRLEIQSPSGGGTLIACYLPKSTLESHKRENAPRRLPAKSPKLKFWSRSHDA